jgi:hypothetical protein
MWDESEKDGKKKLTQKKKRGRKIMDQKANSVADIAAVLGKIGTKKGDAIGLKGVMEGREDAHRVEIRWSDMLDAEFAETWSENVVHDTLDWSKNNREQLDLPRVQIQRLKEGNQLLEQWNAMTPEEKVDLAIGKFGAAIVQEKVKPRLEYEKDQAERRVQWCVLYAAYFFWFKY